MKIVDKAPMASVTPTPSQAPMDKRSAAIAAFEKATAAAGIPPVNQNNVSPENTSIVMPPAAQKASTEETSSAPLNEAAKAPEDPLSSQYATLARKEKALRARAQEQDKALKAREEAFAAKEREYAAREAQMQSKYVDREKLAADPLSTLQDLGLSYDKLVELAMNQPKTEDMERMSYQKKIELELKALRDELDNSKKSAADSQTAQYQQALKQIRSDVTQLVSSDESFETIQATGSIDDVVDLIERTFKEDGNLLTVEEAAREVEEYLVEEALKIARLKKIQAKMKPAEKPAEDKQTAPQQQLKTLTNSVSTSRQLSARERALLAFKGELK